MSKSPIVFHAASIATQSKKDRIPGLGRGPGSKNLLQSSKHLCSLKLLQININGSTSSTARFKLDQCYGIYRADRQNKSGGGLMFLIRDKKYQSINVSSNIIGNSNLEIQGIRINWRGKYLNILNIYQPLDLNKLPIDLQNHFLPSAIYLGDLNAKHFVWGSSSINSRGVNFLNMVDDKSFMFLNDEFPTHYSHKYNSKEALIVTIAIPDLSQACNWKVLENIGSDHPSILFEPNKRQTTYKISNRRWNFERANWQAYTDRAEILYVRNLSLIT
ncbi:RNA-directed DNA polymerase from mobile element jockey [Trichonephila clavipes]|uniref:RNA-directed DNA polymerase from mobile element jockey n=1 Tax=Trichonephila clavipes TaxID=2585209 RepID=A0A8X6SS71_TRICX|nr:RNA-directed DNA polymerase from mobile element jockey [Trichonephila clavipes]